MQVISKQQRQQQQQQQPSSPSSSTSNPIPKTAKDLMQIITQFLQKGQQSALQMRTMIHNKRSGFKVEDDDQQQESLDRHTCVALDSIESCLSVIKSYDHHLEDDMKKRKLDHQSGNNGDAESSDHTSNSDGGKFYRERRGCYKRRKTGQTWTVEATNLIDDGYAWRKYGQKEILHTTYPRNYYRCTHKNDQNCQATKQVQQISENPTKYTITYNGHHTCKTLLKTPYTLEENSSFFLSFEAKNYPLAKHALTPPSMFPSSSAFHNNNNNNNNNNNHHPTLEVKQEQPHPINNETPLAPHDLDIDHDHDIQKQYSSSSDNHKPSSSTTLSDLTSLGLPSTPVSEQGDVISSSAEFFSDATPYHMDDDELIRLFNIDHQCVSLNDGFWNKL